MIDFELDIPTFEKPTVKKLLNTLEGSALALDVSKNHTGVCMWFDNELTVTGFEITEYDNADYHAEYNMRKEFKQKLLDIIQYRSFNYIIIEDVYGGENFDTIRKLLALQTVIDEIIDEGKVMCQYFYRWNQPQWASKARLIFKQSGCLKSKIETQGLLEYLEFDFLLENKDLSNPEKEKIFYEDKCDACGMLMALVAEKLYNNNETKPVTIKMSDIKMKYIEDKNDLKGIRDKVILDNKDKLKTVELNYRGLEKSIYKTAVENPDDILIAELPVSKLGAFGIKKKFKFYESGEGYLIFYVRKK